MKDYTVDLNQESMRKYLEEYDVLDKKYFYWMKTGKQGAEAGEERKILELKARIWKEWYQNGRVVQWNMKNSEDTYQTLKMVYGETDTMELVQCTIDKFLRDYVNIPGIGKLFDSKYFGFEWGMHTEYKDKNKNYSYYRDHYVHQIRNMYEMLLLLDEFGFEELCKEMYGRNKNLIGRHIRNSIDAEIRNLTFSDREIYEKIAEIRGADVKAIEREILFREVIYSASIISALIHDIGYPITYMSRVVDGLQDFIPITRDFIGVQMNISRLYSELEQSILFQYFPHELIEKKLQQKDHGALSAVILLKYYYNKGFIRELSPVKKMVIELAAVITFFHTMKYRIHGRKEADFEQPVFYKDPLSYLFRLCDDIQEWNRVYFEISRNRNYFMCDKCRTMFYFDEKEKIYSCCCGENAGYNITSFYYRRIIHIDTSKKVRLSYRTVEKSEDGGDRFKISISYNLFQLLLMTHYNSSFAKIRADEVKKIKLELSGQRYFPQTYIECTVSANPILLKVKILEAFCERFIPVYRENRDILTRNREGIAKDVDELFIILWGNGRILDTKIKEIINQVKDEGKRMGEQKGEKFHALFQEYEKDVKEEHKDIRQAFVIHKLDFYLRLLFVGILVRENRDGRYGAEELYRFVRRLCESGMAGEWDVSSKALQYLCTDYLYQVMNEVTEEEFYRGEKMENYGDMYIQSDFLIHETASYTEYSRYGRIVEKCHNNEYEKGAIPIDFYSDLYLFYELNQHTLMAE